MFAYTDSPRASEPSCQQFAEACYRNRSDMEVAMRTHPWVWSAVAAVGLAVGLSAQVMGPSFEVISIKKRDHPRSDENHQAGAKPDVLSAQRYGRAVDSVRPRFT